MRDHDREGRDLPFAEVVGECNPVEQTSSRDLVSPPTIIDSRTLILLLLYTRFVRRSYAILADRLIGLCCGRGSGVVPGLQEGEVSEKDGGASKVV